MALSKLALRNLLKHPLRFVLTAASLAVALFLLCNLRSVVTTLRSSAENASSDRLWVQSAVSLYVDLPLSYAPKIAAVSGVDSTCKWQWFGGYYQDRSNFFAQFAVDGAEMLDMFPEVAIVDGSREAWLGQRNACMVGRGLADDFGWQVGQQIPITGALFPHPDGAEKAWEFLIGAIYEPTAPNFDGRTLFFNWDYFEETLRTSDTGTPGVGTVVLDLEPGVEKTSVMASIDEMFANGPQRVQTTTEAEFQAQFVSMFGNVPLFVTSIGGAVLVAILLASLNAMLMASREQVHDIGILKALGFTSASCSALLLVQGLLLCCLGGFCGVGLALLLEPVLADALGATLQGYRIATSTIVFGIVLSVALGLLAGLLPAWNANRLECVTALTARG